MTSVSVTSELDQMLADARARLAPTNSQQPQEPIHVTTTPIPSSATPALAPRPLQKKPSLHEALLAGLLKKNAVAAAAAGIAGGGSAGVDQDRPPAPVEFNPESGWFARAIAWFKGLLARIFGVVAPIAQPASAAIEQVDPRDRQLADLRAELSAARAELARLRAAAAARGFDFSNLDQAAEATSRASDAAARALALDQERDRARQRREVAAMMAAHRGAKAAVAEVSAAAVHVDQAAVSQTQWDAAEARATESASGSSGLDNKDPERAERLREEWLILDRKIRAAHAQTVHDLRHSPSAEPEGLPTDPAARAKLIGEHQAALKHARLAREEDLASWSEERRGIERELWPEDDLGEDADVQQEPL